MFLPPAVMIRSFLRSVIRRKPSVVELADVAGAEPAVLGERRRGRVGVLVVAGEDGVAADQDLAVVGEPDLGAGDGRPTVPNRKSSGSLTVAELAVSVRP